MKTKHIFVALTVGLVLGAAGAKVLIGHPAKAAETPAPTQTAPALTHQQTAWLGALEWCESRGNPKAINPKDKDNTPSYGILQFKPSTFSLFATKYGLASTTDFMNPDAQEAIVTQMVLQGGIQWNYQFPACTARLGIPPMSTSTALNRS